jgi:hypothetical protein
MVYFQAKNRILGKFWRVLQLKMVALLYTFGHFSGHLAYFIAIWYISPPPGLVCFTKQNLATLLLALAKTNLWPDPVTIKLGEHLVVLDVKIFKKVKIANILGS